MTTFSDNIGEVGLRSIRIGGMKLADLSFINYAHVRSQIPLAEDTERKNHIKNLLRKFPSHRLDYVESKIREIADHIERIKIAMFSHQNDADEYRMLLVQCEFRMKEEERLQNMGLAKLEFDQKIKELRKQYPPYDVEAMKKQIIQFQTALDKGEEVLEQENESAKQWTGLVELCKVRDAALKELGVAVTAGNV